MTESVSDPSTVANYRPGPHRNRRPVKIQMRHGCGGSQAIAMTSFLVAFLTRIGYVDGALVSTWTSCLRSSTQNQGRFVLVKGLAPFMTTTASSNAKAAS